MVEVEAVNLDMLRQRRWLGVSPVASSAKSHTGFPCANEGRSQELRSIDMIESYKFLANSLSREPTTPNSLGFHYDLRRVRTVRGCAR